MKKAFVIFQLILVVGALSMVAAMAYSYRSIMAEIDGLRAERAHLQANTALMDMALTDNKAVVQDFSAGYNAMCGPTGASNDKKLPEMLRLKLSNQCAKAGLSPEGWEATFAFLDVYTKAFSLRIQSNSQVDFQKLNGLYGQALVLARKDIRGYRLVAPEWEVRALEGQAYALLRLNQYGQAERVAMDAIKLAAQNKNYGVYVFANLTDMKAECLEGKDVADIQTQYTSLLASLSALAAEHPAGTEYRNFANQDLDTAKTDLELGLFCPKLKRDAG